jgi:hypothetical protein
LAPSSQVGFRHLTLEKAYTTKRSAAERGKRAGSDGKN